MSNLVSRSYFAAVVTAIVLVIMAAGVTPTGARGADSFEGKFYSGQGDVEYLRLLDISRRMFSPDPEFQNVAMLYTPAWNGFVEGPTWGAWWIQNSYGPTYCGLPLFEEPLVTFLQNAQDLWFDQMGDGKRTWKHGEQELVIPDGQLCDAASPRLVHPQAGRRQRGHPRLGHGVHRRGTRDAGRAAADRAATRRQSPITCPGCGGVPTSSSRAAIPRTTSSWPGRPATCWRRATPAGRSPTAPTTRPTWPGCRSPTSPRWIG